MDFLPFCLFFICLQFIFNRNGKIAYLTAHTNISAKYLRLTFLKTDADEQREEELLDQWVRSLPQPYSTRMHDLYAEMEALETQEARIYKALDKMEAVLQHNEAPLSTWIPREYELNMTYGFDQAAFSPYLTKLREQMLEDTNQQIAENKKAP